MRLITVKCLVLVRMEKPKIDKLSSDSRKEVLKFDDGSTNNKPKLLKKPSDGSSDGSSGASSSTGTKRKTTIKTIKPSNSLNQQTSDGSHF